METSKIFLFIVFLLTLTKIAACSNIQKVTAGNDKEDSLMIYKNWVEGSENAKKRFSQVDNNHDLFEQAKWINTDIEFTPDLFKNKVILLDFWATWCKPCLDNMKKNNDYYHKWKQDGFLIIGVCHMRGSNIAEDVIKKYEIDFPIIIDQNNDIINHYKVNGYPDYYLIDRKGKLRVPDCDENKLKQAIKYLLEEKITD